MVVQQILASVEESYILVLAYLLHIITFQLLNTFVRQGDLMLLFKAIELESRPRVHLSILFEHIFNLKHPQFFLWASKIVIGIKEKRNF